MSSETQEPFVLAGDIGGTKTNIGLFSPGVKGPVLHILESFSSRDAFNLEDIITQFLNKYQYPVKVCCFGVAGPVINGQTKTTNLPWIISEEKIRDLFDFNTVYLVNDLVAMALSIPVLEEKDLYSLNGIEPINGQNRALIGPGTGLGISLIPYVEGRYQPQPSEGGHVDFGPNSEQEIQLYQYLQERFTHVSYERLVSGPGLVNIYNWLTNELKSDDQAGIICEKAMAGTDRQCEKALKMFISIFGSTAGNLALAGMATGGVFIGGGICPKILDKLSEGEFLLRFIEKGRYKPILENIPVKVILNDKAPLFGAAQYIIEVTKQGNEM